MREEIAALQEHNGIEIAYAADGSGKLVYGDKHVRIERGDLFILPIAEPDDFFVRMESSRSLRLVNHRLDTRDLGMASPVVPMRWKVLSGYVEEFESLLNKLPHHDLGLPESSSPAFSSEWGAIMDVLLREPMKAELQPFGEDESPIRQALYIMGCRFMNPLSVPEISRLVAMSTRHFQRMFKAVTGRSYMQLLQEIRIRHSCGLLQFSRLSVQSIAETVGIFDMYSFYRLFRNYCGMTPASFRLRRQGSSLG